MVTRSCAKIPRVTHSTRERFDLIDLHDAPIVGIERVGDCVVIRLEHANLQTEHPACASAKPACVGPCVLQLQQVSSEHARLFDDEKQDWVTHPMPGSPLDEEVVEAREQPDGNANRYFFAGMHDAGWSEWEVVAQSFSLAWEAVRGDAWFADWPKGAG